MLSVEVEAPAADAAWPTTPNLRSSNRHSVVPTTCGQKYLS